MSQSENGDEEVNRREVAYRLFAAEFDDADFSYAESDEERAPNYVVTPTGARVNRLFVVGVLTEVEQVNDDVVRARVVDPTGAFVVYAGQYQPEALAALESAETPSFVAVTGKARTFEPDDADVVYTSIRPETVSEVDAGTRNRWVVTTAERTVGRVATAAAAHERVERGDSLQAVLDRAGVHGSLASGIPRALDHYDTSPAYLAAVRDLAVDAARVVSGDADSAGDLSVSPDDGGDAALSFAANLDVEATATPDADAGEPASGTEEAETTAESGVEAGAESDGETTTEPPSGPETEPTTDSGAETEQASTTTTATGEPDVEEATDEVAGSTGESTAAAESADATDATAATDDQEAATTSDDETATTGDEAAEEPAAAADAGAENDGEMYEMSEEEREEVKEEYGVDFSTGTEIPEAGEHDIDAPGPDEGVEPAAGDGAAATSDASDDETDASDDLGDFDTDSSSADDEGEEEDVYGEDEADGDEDDDLEDFTEDEADESQSDAADDESPPADVDLEDYVVDLMSDLGDGDGAPRNEVVTAAANDLDADEGEIEDAIQSALMSGRCYESGDDHLKAI